MTTNKKAEIRIGWVFVFIITILITAYISYTFANKGDYAISQLGIGADDEAVIKIVDACDNNPSLSTDKMRVECVFASMRYHYSEKYKLITPNELVKNGGQCMSWVNFYKVVFDKMNIDYTIVTLDGELNHMLIMPHIEGGYCLVDGKNIDCNGTI